MRLNWHSAADLQAVPRHNPNRQYLHRFAKARLGLVIVVLPLAIVPVLLKIHPPFATRVTLLVAHGNPILHRSSRWNDSPNGSQPIDLLLGRRLANAKRPQVGYLGTGYQ